MAFPNVIYGRYGDEKKAQSTKLANEFGVKMILPDGREFHHAQAVSSATIIAGVVVGGGAETAGHGNVSGSGLLASATTTENLSGAKEVYLISKSAAIVKDEYAGGDLNVVGPAGSTAYGGRMYKIAANDSGAVSSRVKFTLEPYDTLKADCKAGTTIFSLRKNKFAQQNVWTVGTGAPNGVAPTAVSASFYFWVQRMGDASVWQGGTVVTAGDIVHAASAEAGSVTTIAVTAATGVNNHANPIGVARGAGAASEAVIVDLRF